MPRRRRRSKQIRQAATKSTSGLTLSQAYTRFDRIMAHQAESVTPVGTYRQSAWVYGAVNLITTALVNTPFRVYDARGNVVETGPLPTFIRRPSRYPQQDTDSKFRTAYMNELLLNGAVIRTFPEIEGSRPTQMYAMSRHACHPKSVTDENGIQIVLNWQVARSNATRIYIEGSDAYHDALWNPFHDWEGLSPLRAALLTVGNHISVREFTARYYSNDASTGLIMTTDNPHFNNKMAKEAQDRWNEECGGKKNAFGTKFVGMGLTPHAIGGVFDADAQRIIQTMTKEEIVTGIYRIPADIFGSGDRGGTGVTIGAQSMEPAREMFLVNVLIPWARWYDDEFNADVTWRFNATYNAKHDFSGNPVLETRRLERAKTGVTLIDRGVPLNEVIRWLRLEIQQQPHGDEFWSPNWLLPARVIQQYGADVYRAGSTGRQSQSQEEYLDQILSLMARTSTKEGAVTDERVKLNGRSVSNADRITELAPLMGTRQ